MNARDKFKVNDVVVLTPRARMRIKRKSDRGVVTGFTARNPEQVRVRLEGNKFAETYHESYWQVERPAPEFVPRPIPLIVTQIQVGVALEPPASSQQTCGSAAA